MFNNGGATFLPITAVIVLNSLNFFNDWGVNVSTNNPMTTFFLGVFGNIVFKAIDEVDGFFDVPFEHGTERPVTEAEFSSEYIDPFVKPHHSTVGIISQIIHNFPVNSYGIEFVAMNHKETLAGGCDMNDFIDECEAFRFPRGDFSESLIMIANDIGDFGVIVLGHANDFSDNVAAIVVPIEAVLEFPKVNDIAN